MTPTRIYLVKGKDSTALVKAMSKAQAVAFVANKQYSASVPTQDELVKALTSGTVVQSASEPVPAQGDLLSEGE